MLISPTLYQKKFGAPPTPIVSIIGSHRSGLTPISAYNLTEPSANASREERIAYQQSRLRGYTTQLLADLDVISLRSLSIPLDRNPIYPLLKRNRWLEKKDLVLPISHSEKEGISWSAQNPLIWPYLEPCLRLLSRLFARMHFDPFVQALLLGSTETIPIEEFKPQDVFRFGRGIQKLFKRFHPLPYNSSNALRTRQELDRIEEKIFSRRYRFAFGIDESTANLEDNDKDTESSAPPKQGFVAVSIYNRQKMTIVTEYNVYSFRVLMNPNLSDAERLSEEWYVATSMYHEFMHVLGYATEFTLDGESLKEEIKDAASHGALYEPMWKREPKSEFGWAGEASVFGGTHSKILYNKVPDGPGLGTTLDPWPEYNAARHGDAPQLVLPLDSTWASPLPIHMHIQFRSEDFWTLYTRKYGLFHPIDSIGYARGITIEDDYAKDIDYRYKIVLPSNFYGYLSPVSVITPSLHGFLKPSKRTYAEYLSLDQDGRVNRAITLQNRLDRFRDSLIEINTTMHQQSKTLMDCAWLFVYMEEPPEPPDEGSEHEELEGEEFEGEKPVKEKLWYEDSDDEKSEHGEPKDEEPKIEEIDYEEEFNKWLDLWTKNLDNLTGALDICLQNFDICIHRYIVWEEATKSSLYGDRYKDGLIQYRIELESFGANLLKLIESLQLAAGQDDSNIERYYKNSIDAYWVSRKKLSPQLDHAAVVAENELSRQKNKADLDAKIKKSREFLKRLDAAALEPLCNEILHDDLGAALDTKMRAETFLALSQCTSLPYNKIIEYAQGARKAYAWVMRDTTLPDEIKEDALERRVKIRDFIKMVETLK